MIFAVFIALVMIIVVINSYRFTKEGKSKAKDLFSFNVRRNNTVISEDDIHNLPEPVKRYLRFSGVVGKNRVSFVRLKQQGLMKKKQDSGWLPLEAEEYYTVEKPGFIWMGLLNIAPGLFATAHDMYRHGVGNMKVKALSTFTIFDYKNEQTNKAALMRYFNEMTWFPTSLVSDKVKFEAIDSNSAKGTFTDNGMSVSAVFCFDKDGRLINFVTTRARVTDNGDIEMTKWSTPIKSYKSFHGFNLPYKGQAVWHLKSGPYPYIDVTLTDIEYDNPSVY